MITETKDKGRPIVEVRTSLGTTRIPLERRSLDRRGAKNNAINRAVIINAV